MRTGYGRDYCAHRRHVGRARHTSLNPLDRSVKALEARFGPSNVTIRDRVPLTELGHMLERGEVDYFISTSGVSRRNLSEGSRDLLTITDSRFPDPNKSYGSLFFTRRDSGIKRLKDMRGRTLVANHPNGPYSYLVGMGEIERAGYDATAFFKSQRFLMQSAEDVVQAVLDGRADVGVVASCILEDFFPADSEARRKLEPVALKATTPCMRSTDQHPNWTLSAVRGADPETTREVVLTLLGMPASPDGVRWSITTDFQSTDRVFRRLRRHERKKLQRLRRKVLALRRRASRCGLPLLRLCSPIAPHGRDQDP